MNDPKNHDARESTSDTGGIDAGRQRASTLRAAAVGAGLGIFTLVGIGAGTSALAGAQDDPPTTEAPDDAPARGERLADALAPLVADGTLTQEQADAVVARLQEAGAEAREARGERRGPGGFRGHHPGESATEVAELLGLTPEELRESLRSGSTLADLAATAGVTTDDLLDAMLSGVEEHLAQRVADGDITQEQADEHLARATERAEAAIAGERPERPAPPADGSDEGSTEGSSA